ncbi:MAG: hypothetical protein JEY96_19735 [Bacteroidales bacterium]|nr:hypothetical protein [Bacteroidales bacterium]
MGTIFLVLDDDLQKGKKVLKKSDGSDEKYYFVCLRKYVLLNPQTMGTVLFAEKN